MPAVLSELVRLRRPGLLLGWFGLLALFAGMVNAIMFSVVPGGTTLPPGAPGVAFPTPEALVGPDGLMSGLAAASSMFGVVTLSAWAIVTAGDFGSGLIRLLVAAEPRRLRLLAGKVIALAAVTCAAATIAAVVNVAAAIPAAQAAGVSTEAWTVDPVPVVLTAWFDSLAAMLVWGVLGLVLGVLTRSAAIAISVGVGYILLVETIVKMAPGAPSDWLLGTTLNAVAAGGSAALAYGPALALAAGYVIVGLAVAAVVYVRRDVTD